MPSIDWENHDSRQIRNAELIELMRKGLLVVNTETLTVYKFHRKRLTLKAKKPQLYKGRYRFSMRIGERTRTIYRNLLVYLWVHRESPPAGYDVDHRDGNKQNDFPNNLVLRPEGSNRSDNTGATMQQAFTQGQEAKAFGISIEKNPYPVTSNRREDWERGYLTQDEYFL